MIRLDEQLLPLCDKEERAYGKGVNLGQVLDGVLK